MVWNKERGRDGHTAAHTNIHTDTPTHTNTHTETHTSLTPPKHYLQLQTLTPPHPTVLSMNFHSRTCMVMRIGMCLCVVLPACDRPIASSVPLPCSVERCALLTFPNHTANPSCVPWGLAAYPQHGPRRGGELSGQPGVLRVILCSPSQPSTHSMTSSS